MAAHRGIVEGQWFEFLARKSRLSGERDQLEAIAFDPELAAGGDEPEMAIRDHRFPWHRQRAAFDTLMKSEGWLRLRLGLRLRLRLP